MSNIKPTLIGFLPPVGGLPKTEDFYDYHKALINTGDIVYALSVAQLAAGKNHLAWNFSASADVINEAFSQVVWAVPCRIASPPFDQDGFPYEQATQFIEKLEIPFTSLTESVQSCSYEYDSEFGKHIPQKVIRYLKVIAERSRIIGTRGEFSAEVLHGLGIKNVIPIGCPSLYMNGPQLKPSLVNPKPFASVRNVAMAYSNYQLNQTSRIREAMSVAVSSGSIFVEQTSNIVPKLLYYPGKIEALDLLKAGQLYGGLTNIRALFNTNSLRYFTNYGNWVSFLSGMDFVWGARMHGLTPAIQSGTPAHFIAHDCRVREMCEFFHLPFSAEHDDSTRGFDTEALYDKSDYSDAVNDYPNHYRNFIAFLTANEITPNCCENLEILERINTSPVLGVEVEVDPKSNDPTNKRFANELFNIGEAICQQKSVDGYVDAVRDCSTRWQAGLRHRSVGSSLQGEISFENEPMSESEVSLPASGGHSGG